MPLTVSDYRTLSRAQLDLDPTDLPDALIDSYIRLTHALVVRGDMRWPFLQEQATFTTTPGVSTYPLSAVAADAEEIVKMRALDRELVAIGVDDLEAHYTRNSTTTGTPNFYSEWARGLSRQFTLYPIPDTAHSIEVRYYKRPIDFVALGPSGSPTDLPEDFHWLILLGVIEQAYKQQEIGDMAQMYKRQFDEQYRVLQERARQHGPAQPFVIADVASPRFGPARLKFPWE
jgi:hypothetical protein